MQKDNFNTLNVSNVTIYDAKTRHMKRNLYKRPRLHRGMYLNIDMYISTIRANATHILAYAKTNSIQIRLFAITPIRTHYNCKHMLRKQHAF